LREDRTQLQDVLDERRADVVPLMDDLANVQRWTERLEIMVDQLTLFSQDNDAENAAPTTESCTHGCQRLQALGGRWDFGPYGHVCNDTLTGRATCQCSTYVNTLMACDQAAGPEDVASGRRLRNVFGNGKGFTKTAAAKANAKTGAILQGSGFSLEKEQSWSLEGERRLQAAGHMMVKGSPACGCNEPNGGSCASRCDGASDTTLKGLRCCSSTPKSGWKNHCKASKGFRDVWAQGVFDGSGRHSTGDICDQEFTWEQARDFCVDEGARLCTEEELNQGCAKGTGCGLNKKLIWADDQCTDFS
jgi:hypothetical protein